MNYYDRLERIKRMAKMLQGCPIPSEEGKQEQNLAYLSLAEDYLILMLQKIAPEVEVWCGDPTDYGRGNRPMCSEWDDLLLHSSR